MIKYILRRDQKVLNLMRHSYTHPYVHNGFYTSWIGRWMIGRWMIGSHATQISLPFYYYFKLAFYSSVFWIELCKKVAA